MKYLNYFDIREFVPECVYKERGDKSIQLMNPQLVMLCDEMRRTYGAATINNWHIGGERHWSGLRVPNSPYYSKYSQHTYGNAVDAIFNNATAKAIRSDFLEGVWDDYIDENDIQVTLEDDVSWLHIDLRLRLNMDKVWMFKP